ncbi:xylulokinase [Nonomuraea sp. NPDC050310]|uniref:xylulokinase n=1 Tax=Nonomuraea sp. NPDC050310 TaxID=3154935 RepID=UPI0034031CB9
MTLVAGIDSSTQSCKVVVRDAATGRLVRQGRAAHPEGTEVHPRHWWAALQQAVRQAGGLGDVAMVSVAGQQHGMVCLDAGGEVVRDALLWNDTRSAGAAADLVTELGGPEAWAEAVGSVPVAAFTVAKLRWLATHEPDNAARTAAVCLPHDWLTWQLAGSLDGGARLPMERLVTDRGDASGTGYWSPITGEYRLDLLELALGRTALVPEVRRLDGPIARLAAGTGDNMAAALGVGAGPGDVVVSIGTSGTAFAVADRPARDPSGAVAGFADATGRWLPLVCTLNAARVLEAAARMLGVSLDALDDLALRAEPGAGGLVLVPYLEGERTPNLPEATGTLHGLTLRTATPEHLARAAVEGLLCHLADAVDALGVAEPRRVLLVGGGARSRAVRELAPAVFGRPVVVPEPGEYVADGAARQAAWALAGGSEPPAWAAAKEEVFEAPAQPGIRAGYRETLPG